MMKSDRLAEAWQVAGDVLSDAYCFAHVLLTKEPVVTVKRLPDSRVDVTEDFFGVRTSQVFSLESFPQAIAAGLSPRAAVKALKILMN